MEYIYFFTIYFLIIFYKDSIKETSSCLTQNNNYKRELENIKLYLNLKNITLPEDICKSIK
jgi:hypothetical protein